VLTRMNSNDHMHSFLLRVSLLCVCVWWPSVVSNQLPNQCLAWAHMCVDCLITHSHQPPRRAVYPWPLSAHCTHTHPNLIHAACMHDCEVYHTLSPLLSLVANTVCMIPGLAVACSQPLSSAW
jgi:hypothetical protein